MTRRIKSTWWIAALISLEFTSAGWTQDIDAGKSEFLSSCAICHGLDGKGNGPLSSELKTAPPDLTVLAKKNNGFLPLRDIYDIIDGRNVIASHGSREMPIWGKQFSDEALVGQFNPEALNRVDSTFDAEAVVRTRILSIVEYLNRIQEP